MGRPDSRERSRRPARWPACALLTGTHLSVSSGIGFLALFGVSVETGVIMLEYINQLRVRGYSIEDSAIEGAVLRLRPIMMTMLVATLGLLPAAMSKAIGSDSQRPFAIVIVGGLITALVMGIFLLPALYVWIARDGDKLPETGRVLRSLAPRLHFAFLFNFSRIAIPIESRCAGCRPVPAALPGGCRPHET